MAEDPVAGGGKKGKEEWDIARAFVSSRDRISLFSDPY
jgi:hypothetical protein